MNADLPFEISVEEVQQLLQDDDECVLLDCRQPEEYAIAHLTDAKLVPLQELPERLHELESNRQSRMVVYCHHGMRSEMVTAWLREQGFPFVQNMTGGIDAWSCTIDTSLPRY